MSWTLHQMTSTQIYLVLKGGGVWGGWWVSKTIFRCDSIFWIHDLTWLTERYLYPTCAWSHNSGTKSQKIDIKVVNEMSLQGLQKWGRIAKIRFFGQKPGFRAKKTFTSGWTPYSGHDQKKFFKGKSTLFQMNISPLRNFGFFFG